MTQTPPPLPRCSRCGGVLPPLKPTATHIPRRLLCPACCAAAIADLKAATAVFLEMDWRPGLMVQAEDRIHRIGQCRTRLDPTRAWDMVEDLLWRTNKAPRAQIQIIQRAYNNHLALREVYKWRLETFIGIDECGP